MTLLAEQLAHPGIFWLDMVKILGPITKSDVVFICLKRERPYINISGNLYDTPTRYGGNLIQLID